MNGRFSAHLFTLITYIVLSLLGYYEADSSKRGMYFGVIGIVSALGLIPIFMVDWTKSKCAAAQPTSSVGHPG